MNFEFIVLQGVCNQYYLCFRQPHCNYTKLHIYLFRSHSPAIMYVKLHFCFGAILLQLYKDTHLFQSSPVASHISVSEQPFCNHTMLSSFVKQPYCKCTKLHSVSEQPSCNYPKLHSCFGTIRMQFYKVTFLFLSYRSYIMLHFCFSTILLQLCKVTFLFHSNPLL
jgi:hypothetical protein